MKKQNERTYVITLIITILGLAGLMLYNHFSFYNNIIGKMLNTGMGNLESVTAKMEGSIKQDFNILQSTSIILEYMLDNNASKEELYEFLVYENQKFTNESNSDFSGIYGVINGDFIHGTGWIPDEDYDPYMREWYTTAKDANGEIVLVSPYLDAKSNTTLLSASKMLPDKTSVVSLDINLNKLQQIIETAELNSYGYAFVINDNGTVISHSDVNEQGKNYLSDTDMKPLIEDIFSAQSPSFQTSLDGVDYQVFTQTFMNDWHVTIIFDRDMFFKDVNNTLLRNLLLFGIISALIVFFYIYTFKNLRRSMELERISNKKIETTNMNMIRALVRTIDAKDRYTNGHSIRVADYALKIAQKMGKSKEEQQVIYYAGLLHDVGKIRIPEEIINAERKLTDEEFEKIKIHPVTGYHILKDIYEDKSLAIGAKYHHERFDGNGYPSGLAGENIPEIARIIGVADTYDAMTSNRSYRNALPQDKVRAEFERCKGTQFDPQIAEIMLQMIDADKEYKLKENTALQKTILVVDDDPVNIKVTQLIMKEQPLYQIIGATSGERALTLLDTTPVDLVLLDVEMPDMDGFETLAKIRKKYQMPVAIMTGNKDIETIQKANKLGVDDYISKPFVPLALSETIHSILNA